MAAKKEFQKRTEGRGSRKGTEGGRNKARPSGPSKDQALAGIRLQVYLARAGVASRRACEELMTQGLVTVNGEMASRLGTRVDPEVDHVKVNGRLIHRVERLCHVVLNKPTGVISTASDPERRTTVVDLVRVPGPKVRLYPVGRLDVMSEGLIILTNDGELAHGLLHPRHSVPRVYHVKIRGRIDAEEKARLEAGIVIKGKRALPLQVKSLKAKDNASWVEIVAHEGRQHLVRDAMEAIGHQVVRLRRMSFGPLRLGTLAVGEHRNLTSDELEDLREAIAEGMGMGKSKRKRPGRGFAKAKPRGVRQTKAN